MQVDLDQTLTFPQEIITTDLRPDLIMWSPSKRCLCIVELTVQWDAAGEEAYDRKWLKNPGIAAGVENAGAP